LVSSAHEDHYLRTFDLRSGECVKSILAHKDALSAIDIDSTGQTLVTSSHDGFVRLWDTRTYQCIQEINAHKRKLDEGTCAVRFHSNQPWLATGGADSIVKIFS
jgi:striatin 1/3/4